MWQWSDWEIEPPLTLQQLPQALRKLSLKIRSYRDSVCLLIKDAGKESQRQEQQKEHMQRKHVLVTEHISQTLHYLQQLSGPCLFTSKSELSRAKNRWLGWSKRTEWRRLPDPTMFQGPLCEMQPQPLVLPLLLAELGACETPLCCTHQLSPQLHMPDRLLRRSPSKTSQHKEAGPRQSF